MLKKCVDREGDLCNAVVVSVEDFNDAEKFVIEQDAGNERSGE